MDINVDMGESFGRYKLGNDEEVMKHITSAFPRQVEKKTEDVGM